MSIMSNTGAGVQRLFGNAGGKIKQAASKIRSSLSFYDHNAKPYSKMSHAEREAYDLENFAPDDRAMTKHHEKMVKRYGPDYADRDIEWMMEEPGPSKKRGWW